MCVCVCVCVQSRDETTEFKYRKNRGLETLDWRTNLVFVCTGGCEFTVPEGQVAIDCTVFQKCQVRIPSAVRAILSPQVHLPDPYVLINLLIGCCPEPVFCCTKSSDVP